MTTSSGPRGKVLGAWLNMRREEALWAYSFVAPYLVGLLVFTVGPVIASLYISLTKWDMLQAPRFVGAANYSQLLTSPDFWQALWNTAYFTVGVTVPSVFFALLLAVAMNQKVRGILVFRTAFFVPVVSSVVAVSLLWAWIYNPEFGLFNYILGKIGVPPQDWLGNKRLAMPAIILMSIWKGLGYRMLLFLAGLQDIPDELYEAAQIDGAGGWAKLRYITVPLVSHITFFVTIMTIISSFQVFEQTYVMTGGGPGGATTTIVLLIFNSAFRWFKMGYSSALAYTLFILIFVLTLLQVRFQAKWVHYE